MNRIKWLIFGLFSILPVSLFSQPAKNVILFISDGCGYQHVAAANYFEFGAAGKSLYEHFPVQCGMSTYSLKTGGYRGDLAWQDFKYVTQKPTDSAAASTAMSTGVKTNNGAIGMDSTRTPLKTVVEHFEASGKATGVITTVQFSHATPAGMVAHNVSRNNYAQIAQEMILKSQLDVIIGTGHPFFDDDGRVLTVPDYQYVGDAALWQGLLAGDLGNDADGDRTPDRWHLIETREAFQQIGGTNIKRLIGVPRIHTTLQQMRSGNVLADPFVVPLNQSVPTLTEMALAGLSVLSRDPDGFFVMIEGGAIDWASHENQSGRMIEEQIDFNHAVTAVYQWVEKNSHWNETLLLVTADHECGFLTGAGSGKMDANSDSLWKPIANRGKGRLPGMEWKSNEHTNQLVPFYAIGAGSEKFIQLADEVDPVRGKYIDNTEIAHVIFELLHKQMQMQGTH